MHLLVNFFAGSSDMAIAQDILQVEQLIGLQVDIVVMLLCRGRIPVTGGSDHKRQILLILIYGSAQIMGFSFSFCTAGGNKCIMIKNNTSIHKSPYRQHSFAIERGFCFLSLLCNGVVTVL